jgi:hypothetical protein
MICKQEDDAEDSDGDNDADHCMWDKLEHERLEGATGGSSHAISHLHQMRSCPAQHTLMEHHHLHDCVEYDTGMPKMGLERLKCDLGLGIKSGPSGAGAGTVAGLTEHDSSSSHPSRQPLGTSSNSSSSSSGSSSSSSSSSSCCCSLDLPMLKEAGAA